MYFKGSDLLGLFLFLPSGLPLVLAATSFLKFRCQTPILSNVPQIHQARIYTATQIGLPIAFSMINWVLSQ
jgi:hypothetical protein